MTLNQAAKILEDAGTDSPRHDAIEIFSFILGLSRSELFINNPDSECETLVSAIKRRASREPLQYIIGNVCFYRETYEVSSDCLIPRSDTEILVDYAVRSIPDGESFLDLCTGSGCIAISTLKNTKNTTALAVDLSDKALRIAKKNAILNMVEDRLTLLNLDVLTENADGKFYAILSNPPYVSEQDYKSLSPEIFFEPQMAFLGGADGLKFYRTITEKYRTCLKPNGFIAYEIGYDQAEAIRKIANDFSMSCEIIKDYSGNNRVAVLKEQGSVM